MKKNRRIFILSLLLLIFLLFFIKKSNNSYIYQNLQGFHNFDRNFVHISRHGNIYNVSSFTKVKRDKISLDIGVINMTNESYLHLERKTDREKYGRWKVISNNPDSIEIEDPKSFFSGRYSVEFGIAYGFPPHYAEDTLWTLLENDSTHLVLYKLSKNDSEIKNWIK